MTQEMLIAAPPENDWVGRSQERDGCLTPDLAKMLGAAVGHDGSAVRDLGAGAVLPPLWHWSAFNAHAPHADLGADGHPRLGGFLPPLRFSRRMWAGGRLRFEGSLEIGEPLRRRSEILSVEEKEGGTGGMAFVTVAHEITGAFGGRIHEEQDIVYLDIPDSYRPPKQMPVPENLAFSEPVEIDEARLFRFSAATFNAHRIHYDLAYARDVEKYPALVVHGPMQAIFLMDAAERHTGQTPTVFRFRGRHPMFHTDKIRLTGTPDPKAQSITLGTATDAGYLGLTAVMEWST